MPKTEKSTVVAVEEQPSAAGAAPSSMADLAAAVEYPEPKENAIAAMMEQTPPVPEESVAPAPKKRGRPPGSKTKAKIPLDKPKIVIPGESAPEPEAAPQKPNGNLEMAALTSATLEQLQVALMGEDMIYSPFERDANVTAYDKLYTHYWPEGMPVHPVAHVLASHVAIIVARANKPRVQTKFGLLKAWIVNKFANMRGRKNAPVDSRPNDERKDDVGQKDGPGGESAKR